jgi:hypothetical protein
MNIIKEFEDQEFFCLPEMSSPEYHGRYTWFWGLSSNGDIYFRCTRFTDPDEWRELRASGQIAELVSLKTMKKLVKHFGHLLIFT